MTNTGIQTDSQSRQYPQAPTGQNNKPSHYLILLFVAICLGITSCGGGGGGSQQENSGSNWSPGVFEDADKFVAKCAVPRVGTDVNGNPFPDVQGSVEDENNWLRSWSNDLYLWYDEIVDRDPSLYTTSEYFALLKTEAITSSGRQKDNFHFSIPTDEWIAQSQSGVSFGYGVNWVFISPIPPRQLVVAFSEPGSPAAIAGLKRGDRILRIDGVDLVNDNTQAGIDILNAGISPSQIGERHEFAVRNLSGVTSTVTMTSANVTSTPVTSVSTLSTATGDVGYILFNDHIATAEQGLIDAIDQLNTTGITDLVVDLRYNSGGFLDIASQFAYMIAGSAATSGEVFEQLRFNDKHQTENPVTGQPLTPRPFLSTTTGWFTLPAGQPLPTLDLSRVYLLTGSNTCSASESIINSLRGVNVDVIQIGSTTCGKPYGFYPWDNCGETYFTIQFKGENAKGFGEYTDGFSPQNTPARKGVSIPGCSVADDYTHQLGDPLEARFAAALNYRATATCAPATGLSASTTAQALTKTSLSTTDGVLPKSLWLQNRIILR